MTIEEFKKERPEYAHLEGDELWDAMTFATLREQQAEKVLQQIEPFWKRYKLRYLFYVRKPNAVFSTPESATKRCAVCKEGVASLIMWGGKTLHHCGAELIEEPNTNLNHYWYLVKKYLKNASFVALEFLHIVRYDHSGRYEMFGDEAHYVLRTRYSKDWEYLGREMRPRKWWEYIFIEKI